MKLRFVIGILFLITGFNVSAGEQADIDKANKAYMAGFYENAITIYEKVINDGMVSPELYYNLGNAYFKTNNLPSSILNYERALKFAPGDEDIVYNLGVANSRIVDKIEILPELFYIRWWKIIKTWFSPDGWAITGIASFSLLFIIAALFLLSRSVAGRKGYFITGIILLLVNIISGVIAWQTYQDSRQQNSAIVFTPTLPVKSSPDESSIDLFVIHEGLKVMIMDKLGEWNEIKIANGSKGWVKADNLEPV
ncbi:MAG: tetratricopeptide repeat protein [Bacteroidota bacterium]